MKKVMSYFHRAAGVIAFLIILSFFCSTVFVELQGDPAQIAAVKNYIVSGMWVLIPCIITAGITGNLMVPGVKGGVIGSKKKRMPFIAVNGLFVLLPSAVYLNYLASEGQLDTVFYTVQGVELLAGFINLSLMFLNIRDGFRIVRARSRHQS
ncbi:hypothetical protein [Aliamphritea spongicola]|uniref:hypothetical protein n=1 Tax=Aliamphritea spongicola TaxID=707589 RepID=UPI00196B52A9|nr:hypothetical protein [Aliamphritea spongicola]MBN3561585.1 hypothetical protein [Aliamphritea spongicola]